MSNIYDGCVDNKKVIYGITKEDVIKEFEKYIKKIKDKYCFAIVDCSGGIIYGARIVKYKNDIPEIMLQYKHRWIYKENQWIRLGLLGVCDVCKQEKELTCLCDEGNICSECDSQINW